MALNPREGRWGLSRIVQEADGGFTTVALRDRLADGVECYYPPLNATKTAYTLPFAAVRLEGNIGTPTADTRLIPQRLLSATLGDLSAAQRTTLGLGTAATTAASSRRAWRWWTARRRTISRSPIF